MATSSTVFQTKLKRLQPVNIYFDNTHFIRGQSFLNLCLHAYINFVYTALYETFIVYKFVTKQTCIKKVFVLENMAASSTVFQMKLITVFNLLKSFKMWFQRV